MLRRLAPLVVLTACSVSPATSTTAPSTTTEPVTATTAAPSPDDPAPVPACLSGSRAFVESGSTGTVERAGSDSRIVGGIRWTRHDGCDRLVVEFATLEGAPAVIPPGVGGLFNRSAGVLRLEIDGAVTGSAVRDQVVDTPIASHAYVARRADASMFIDIHLTLPAEVRVTTAASPARVIVDLVLGGAPYPNPPIITDDMVVVDPVGDTATYPFTVNGYWLTSETEVVVAAANADAGSEARGPVGPGPDTWGAFTVLLSGPTPGGPSTITVGPDLSYRLDLVG